MTFDFEISVDQHTRARDRTFEGVLDSGFHRCPRDSHAHIWSINGPILSNHLNMLKTMLSGALLVAPSLLSTYISLPKLDMIKCTKYDRFWPINRVNINIFE